LEKVKLRLANSEDNDELLRLVDSISMGEEFEIIFKRNPNFFYAAETQGFLHQIVVAELEGNSICASCSRILKQAYINGNPAVLGYISDLRIAPTAKRLRILSNGSEFIKKLQTDNEADIHFATIVNDNKNAKIALTWKNKSSSIPNLCDLGTINTYFVFPIFRKRLKNNMIIKHGSLEILDDIVSFLNEEGRRKQFYPIYTREYFLNLRDFHIEDFCIAYNDENQIIGVAAKWVQTNFKQVFLKKYHGKMKWLQKISFSLLPKEGENIKHVYFAFIAIQNDDANVLKNILLHTYPDIRKQKFKYFVIGFHEDDPLNKTLQSFYAITYKSQLYAFDYNPNSEIKTMLDTKIPYIEIATL
jgi:hypothetical protein